ncbi:hypothetical protein WSM22_40510 [Cytophagales bacterium WSM2-2]|nr:hypothetical protein WSM22_40510 [Cytophagales bacterium WSM2-2]
MNSVLLNQANQDWNSFVNQLSEEEKKGLGEYADAIDSNNLFFYTASKDTARFDQILSRLPKRYLYDELAIPVIYQFYNERKLHELAYEYALQAEAFLAEEAIPVAENIQHIFNNSVTRHLLESLKRSLMMVRGLEARDLPLITPDVVNDKRILSEFILNEFVKASRILLDKIEGIKKNRHEDRFTDLLLAILKLRFDIWAWGIHDQARKGRSTSGIGAGETDLTIESGGNTIALFEALILSGKNKKETQKHVLKSFGYVKYLDRYFMVVYYLGAKARVDSTWASYKTDVSTAAFPPPFAFDAQKGFEDLSSKFGNVNHLRIAKSCHGSQGVEMFHLMIDLSQ